MNGSLLETSVGTFRAGFSSTGLAKLEFPSGRRIKPGADNGQPKANGKTSPWKKQTEIALNEILRGQKPWKLPPLDVSGGTEFQRRVWSALQSIPPGRTLSYAEVAEKIGRPKASRAVGQACGANPIPVLIPCHRVLAANRKMGGFSGGLEWKKKLLAIEGVKLLSPSQD